MRKFLLLVFLVLLSSCGLVRMEEVSQMSQSEIGMMNDEMFCKEARRFIYLKSELPVNVIREAQRRNLEYCIDKQQVK